MSNRIEDRPRIANGLNRATIGDETVITLDGSIFLSLTPEEIEILDALDGSVERSNLTRRFGPNTVDLLGDLDRAGFLEGSVAPPQPRLTFTASGVEFAGFDRFIRGAHRLVSRPLTRTAVALLALVGFGGALALLVDRHSAGIAYSAALTLTVLLVASFVGTIIHETAHAMVIHHHGRTVGRAGFGFYWGDVAFFVDATDAFFLTKRQRLSQALAGPAVDLFMASVLTISAQVFPEGPTSTLLLRVAVNAWLILLINALPVLKFDGFWALSDLLGTSDLYGEARRAVTGLTNENVSRRTLALSAFLLASVFSGVALLAVSYYAWTAHFLPLVLASSTEGIKGRLVAVAFTAPTAVGLLAPALHQTKRIVLSLMKRIPTVREEVSTHVEASHSPAEPRPI